ncbi:hypothetical protein LIER_32985 [Lithospermum erythrorhizon]|uniref:Pentatricopeptide repeat-containing protein n=1 Tax=Lithospermum erythrorhizon TaxID=34254 RepID=A0AAV3RZA7_LITER
MKNPLTSLFSVNSTSISLKTCISKSIDLLKHFTNQKSISHGESLHAHLIKIGIDSEKYLSVKLLIMYSTFKKPLEVDQILKQFDGFNLVVRNCLIHANMQTGDFNKARKLFDEMPERNEVSWTALISGLMRLGKVEDAMWYFGDNPFRNLFTWTAVITGLVQNGLCYKAMGEFRRMIGCGVMPNDVTFTSVLRGCGEMGDFLLGMCVMSFVTKVGFAEDISVCNALITFCLRLKMVDLARSVFNRMGSRDVVSWTAILDMYIEMGDLKQARRIFDEIPEKNEVSWSAMIARYSQSGYAEEAAQLFQKMVLDGFKPNTSCISCVLNALASLKALPAGRNIHGLVVRTGREGDVFIASSLIDLYCKCGETKDGREVFDSILHKNVVCWNSLVAGYSLNGQLGEAIEVFDRIPNKNNVSWNSLIAGCVLNEQFDEIIEVFNQMLLSGELPNKSTFSSVLCACASLASLDKGKNLHGKIIKYGFGCDVFVGTALIDMYAKSGDVESSRLLFKRIKEKNDVCWTAMLQGLAENGHAKEVLDLFYEMERTTTVPPNELIFLAVLFACSHRGLVDRGLYYFNSMEKVYGVHPNEIHCTCVVDMLSRSGRLSEAEKFMENMPCEPEVNAWAALLSGCKMHRDEERSERAAEKLKELTEKKPGGYVLLSNIYASAGRWHDVSVIRKLMKEKGLKKSGGCSWIEVKNRVHLFYSQDGSHGQSLEMFGILDVLAFDMFVL